MGCLRVIAPELPFPIIYKEIEGAEQCFEMNGYRLKAFRVNHNVLCYGYTIEIDRSGKFDPVRAKEQNIPQKYWSVLQRGECVEAEEGHFTPEMVLGPPRKGIKLTYTTDTRPAELARETQVKELWLTHYSPSLTRPEPYMEDVRKIFPNAKAGKDGKSVDLMFEE